MTKQMTPERERELIQRYSYPGATLEQAEKAASGYALTLDESQPVDDDTLSADIDEMREHLKEQKEQMDRTIAIIIRDGSGKPKAYPANRQAERLADIAGTKTLTQRTLATASAMGFDIQVAMGGGYRAYTEADVLRLA